MSNFLSQSELRGILIDREAIPVDRFFIIRLTVVPREGLTLEEAALRILLIVTGRTLNELPYEQGIRSDSNGHILSLNPDTGTVEIALPEHLCTHSEGLAHLIAVISSPAEYNYADEYWIENIELPKDYAARFPGPRFGIDGVRKLLAVPEGPITGVVFKPRHRVPINNILKHLAEALIGGCSFIVDDLLLVDREGEFSFESRVARLVDVAKSAAEASGREKGYIANIGVSGQRSIELGEEAIKLGAAGLVVNGFAMGIGTVEEVVRNFNGQVPIFACNMGFGILTRPRLLGQSGKTTGLSETIVSKFSRLAGVDGVHAGTSASECYGSDAWGPATRALKMPFFGVKRCFPIAEGDLNIANIWDNIRSLGSDMILEPTSGILATPLGPRRAAKAFTSLGSILSEDMTEHEAQEAIGRFATKHGNEDVAKLLDHFGFMQAGEGNA